MCGASSECELSAQLQLFRYWSDPDYKSLPIGVKLCEVSILGTLTPSEINLGIQTESKKNTDILKKL